MQIQQSAKLVLILAILLFPSIPPARAAGVTIITHGFNDNATNSWVDTMAEAMSARIFDEFAEAPTIILMRVAPGSLPGQPVVYSSVLLGDGLTNNASGEIIVELDWSAYAGQLDYADLGDLSLDGDVTNTFAVAETVVPQLLNTNLLPGLQGHALAELPIHLIGHSRGGSLICEMAKELGEHGVWVDQVTTLDPHPLNTNGDSDPFPITDAPVAAYANVVYADNYYETSFSIPIIDYAIHGFPIAGAANVGPMAFDVGTVKTELGYWFEDTFPIQHDDVHLWYSGTVDTNADAAEPGPTPVPTQAPWYSGDQGPRARAGFYKTRLGGGPQPAGGRARAFGGTAKRVAVPVSGPQWPGVLITSVPATNLVMGGSLRCNCHYEEAQAGGSISIRLDPDANPGNGNSIELGTVSPASVSNAPMAASLSASLTGVAPGSYYLCLQITATNGLRRYDYWGSPIQVASTNPPVLAIVSPTAGETVSKAACVVAGTTEDDGRVASVEVSLNRGGWVRASTTNGWTNWSASVKLEPGTNSVRAYAVDNSGNHSLTNRVTFACVPTKPVSHLSAEEPGLAVTARPVLLITDAHLTPDGLNFSLRINGAASGLIQASADLANWSTVTRFADTNTMIQFCDPTATNCSQRYYRAVVP